MWEGETVITQLLRQRFSSNTAITKYAITKCAIAHINQHVYTYICMREGTMIYAFVIIAK